MIRTLRLALLCTAAFALAGFLPPRQARVIPAPG